MRFLVIDDERDIASMIERVLKPLGHQCRSVTSAAAALRAIEEASFDRVVSDLNMPGMTGDALYELLASRKNPIIRRMAFMTGNATDAQNGAFLGRTGVLVLEKPFTIAELKEFIRKVEDLGEATSIGMPGAVDLRHLPPKG